MNKVCLIGSLAMDDAFWYDCNYHQDGHGGTPCHQFMMEKRLQKRLKADVNTDIDVLLLDPEVTDEEVEKFLDYNLYSWRGAKLEKHNIPILSKYIQDNNCPTNEGKWESNSISKNVLFTLKASHVAYDTVHKRKTFYDLWLMSYCGCKIIPELYFSLESYWKEKFGEVWRADFSKETKEFFTDAISREEFHDELHWKMKKFDKPAFMYLQEEGQTTVYVDEEKFWEVDEEVRRRVVIEEAQTLAIERDIEPKLLMNQDMAYQKFIEGLVDRLAPLWMTVYILDNFNYFMDYREDYVSKYNS